MFFQTLDSIQGRKCKLPVDEVKENTKLMNADDQCNEEFYDSDYDACDDAGSVDTYNEGEHGEDTTFDDDDCTKRKLNDLKNGDHIQDSHLIGSHIPDNESLFCKGAVQAGSDIGDTSDSQSGVDCSTGRKGYEQCDSEDDYRTILAFIGGATVSNIIDSDICSTFLLDVMKQCWSDDSTDSSDFATANVPVLNSSTKAAREKVIQ